MNHYLEILNYIRLTHPKLKSDFARLEAYLVAEAAGRGHITTVIAGRAAFRWYITEEGIKFLKQYKGDYVYH